MLLDVRGGIKKLGGGGLEKSMQWWGNVRVIGYVCQLTGEAEPSSYWRTQAQNFLEGNEQLGHILHTNSYSPSKPKCNERCTCSMCSVETPTPPGGSIASKGTLGLLLLLLFIIHIFLDHKTGSKKR